MSNTPFVFRSRATTGIGVEVALSPTSSYPRSQTPTWAMEMPAGNPAADIVAKLTEVQPVVVTETLNSGLAETRRGAGRKERMAPGEMVARLGNERADSALPSKTRWIFCHPPACAPGRTSGRSFNSAEVAATKSTRSVIRFSTRYFL